MPKRSSRPRKSPPQRAPLSREAISRAALDLIDREGLDGLSMRRLGAALGVEAMALYHHFDGKGKVLDAVMERLLDEVEWPARGAAPPLARMRAFMESYRQLAIRHPHAFILLAYRRFNTDQTFALYEQFLEAMSDLGLDDALSARYFRMLGYYVNGAGLAEIASRAAPPDATPVQLENFKDGKRFPRVAAVARHLKVSNLGVIFDFGIEMIFSEMQASARKTARKR